ncbi:hypothetical protein KR222_004775, partial [Zaprionus bogoriensis]
GKRKSWTVTEEDKFLRIWYSNLWKFHSGRKRSEIYRDMEVELLSHGILISGAHIKAKMESFKRKYFQIVRNNKYRKSWNNFEKMVTIMEYDEPSKTISQQETNSVCVDEDSEILFKDEQCSASSSASAGSVPQPAANRTRPSNGQTHKTCPQQPRYRRLWTLKDEDIFLDVWQFYARDLQSERKKRDVYTDMQLMLKSKGIIIRAIDIKAKIESFTRKFRRTRESGGSNEDWIHYSIVANLLGALGPTTKLDQNSEKSGSSRNWYAYEQPITSELSVYSNTSQSYKSLAKEKENMDNGSNLLVPSMNAAKSEVFNWNGDFYGNNDQKYNEFYTQSSMQTSSKAEITEQFGYFVTKELNMLNDNLLIEAKRRIYDIICIMQMKQLNVNNS